MKYAFKKLTMWLGMVLIIAAIVLPTVAVKRDPIAVAVKNYEKFLDNPCKRTYKKCIKPETYAAMVVAGATIYDLDALFEKYQKPENVRERTIYMGGTEEASDGGVYVKLIVREVMDGENLLLIDNTKIYDTVILLEEENGKYYWD